MFSLYMEDSYQLDILRCLRVEVRIEGVGHQHEGKFLALAQPPVASRG